MGLAFAYLIRSVTLLIGSKWLLSRLLPSLSIIPCHWNRSLFREMLNYGINFQIISVVQIMLDPITKSLMTKFGGLSMTGYYEMAYRMVTQLRGVLVFSNSVIVPVVADLNERTSEAIFRVYQSSFKLLLFLSFPFYGFIIALIPAISQIWIGHFEKVSAFFGIIVSVAYFINTLCGPAYFSNLGTGRLKDNVVSHIIMGVLNLTLGYVLGKLYGGYGVVLAWAVSVGVGSAYLFIAYSIHEKASIGFLVSREDVIQGIISLFALFGPAIIYYYSFEKFHWSSILQAGLVIMVYTIGIFLPAWRHSMRTRIQGWLIHFRAVENF
jgi:O-antigen/teichoic acid export membrane protein